MSNGQQLTTLKRTVWVTAQNYGVPTILAIIIIAFAIPGWIQWCIFYLGGVVFLASLIATFVEKWRPKARVQTQGKVVFISGCDSGFGHLLAQRLDDLGLHVFAGCLFPENDGAQTLKKSCSEKLHVVPLDVTSDESVHNAAKYVIDNLGSNKLWAVVNNAGVNAGAKIAWTSVDTMKRVFEVNTFGVMRTTKAFLPLLCKDKGRIVTVASAAGRHTYSGMVPYCMTKCAIINFCEGLRIETYRFGVKVITIEPWYYKTNITEKNIILEYITKSWEDAPVEVKELYPKDYIEKYKRYRARELKFFIIDRPQEVVDCMEEAILALDPMYVYSPGPIYGALMHCVVKRLPRPIAGRFIRYLFSLFQK